jgi:RNA polymerase sigma-70 factor (ECF subfamily)
MRRLPRKQTDRDLLNASRDGAGGFDAFYLRHHHAVLAYLVGRVREPEIAADLTAETFAAALVAVHDRERTLPLSPVAWLFTIAHRKWIDSLRRGRVEDEARRRLALEPLALDDEALARIEQVAGSTGVLAHLADWLPPDQVHALCERIVAERDYSDIAGQLHCSEAVVRMRVSRALTTLRSREAHHHD